MFRYLARSYLGSAAAKSNKAELAQDFICKNNSIDISQSSPVLTSDKRGETAATDSSQAPLTPLHGKTQGYGRVGF
jgi:hypothetical protein